MAPRPLLKETPNKTEVWHYFIYPGNVSYIRTYHSVVRPWSLHRSSLPAAWYSLWPRAVPLDIVLSHLHVMQPRLIIQKSKNNLFSQTSKLSSSRGTSCEVHIQNKLLISQIDFEKTATEISSLYSLSTQQKNICYFHVHLHI